VSLAIAKALLVRTAGRSYAIPLHFAERMVDAVEAVFVESAGVRRVKIDDHLLPVSSLERHFAPETPARPGPVRLARFALGSLARAAFIPVAVWFALLRRLGLR